MSGKLPSCLTSQSQSRFIRAALGCAVAGALVFASVAAKAEDDNDDVPLDKKIIRGIMSGLGLKRDGEGGNGINYQERAPLVIPPDRSLPPPEKADNIIANNPAWPKDYDIQRKKAAAKMAKQGQNTDQTQEEMNALRPDQMTPGRNVPGANRAPEGATNETTDWKKIYSPSELGFNNGMFGGMFGGTKDEYVKFTGEPPRTALTQPPAGYQTPSPNQPYGVSKDSKYVTPQATDYYSSHVEAGKE